jgi:hypothetical protein
VADLPSQIELFLRNALRERTVEDRLVRQAIQSLRSTLQAVEQLVISSGVLALGLNRNQAIQAISAAVARTVQQTWGIPQLALIQEALEPFVDGQLEFARRMVRSSGGTLANSGAASVNVARIVNDAVINGKTLSQTLTQSFPALVADRVERYIRLGLNQVSGEVLETISYKDAVVTVTERNVEAIIKTGVHEVGSFAQQAIYEFEADPDWLEGKLTWTAVLDSAVCPICVALDGKEYELGQPGRYFDGSNKVSPHMQCRCYLVPSKWRDESMTAPNGDQVSARRPVDGDRGEEVLSFKRSVNAWLKDNPDTTRAIFGKALGNRLLNPNDKLDLPAAVKIWQAPKRAT